MIDTMTRKQRSRTREQTDTRAEARPVTGGQPDARPETHPETFYSNPLGELQALARAEGIPEPASLSREQLTVELARARSRQGHTLRGAGTLEVLAEGFGFLRRAEADYLNS